MIVLYRFAVSLVALLFVISSAAQAQVQLLGRGWLVPAAPLTGVGTMTPDDRVLSQWWTPLPYGAEANTLRFSYAGFNAASETAGMVVLGARVSIVDRSGVTLSTHSLKFGGSGSATIAPNSVRYTDALPVEVPVGARAVVRTLYSVDAPVSGPPTLSRVWSTRQNPDGGMPAMGLSVGRDVTLDTPLMQGAVDTHWAGLSDLHRFYTPGIATGAALVSSRQPPLAILSAGNSHGIGMNDFIALSPDDPWHAAGWQGRAFQEDVPFAVIGSAGTFPAISADNPFFAEGASLTNHMIWQFGHNELRINDGQVSTVGDRILSMLAQDAQTAASFGVQTSAATMWRFNESSWNSRPVAEWYEAEQQRLYVNEQMLNNYAAYGTDTPLDMAGWVGTDIAGYVPTEWSSEGLHLDAAGHQVVADRIREEWLPLQVTPQLDLAVAAPEPAAHVLFVTGLLPLAVALARRRKD